MQRNVIVRVCTRTLYVCVALILITHYWALLRLRPHRVLRNAVRAPRLAAGVDSAPPTSPLRPIMSAVDRAADLHPLKPQCLERALTVRALLTPFRQPCRVVIGVSRERGALTAHAWVELDVFAADGSREAFVQMVHLP